MYDNRILSLLEDNASISLAIEYAFLRLDCCGNAAERAVTGGEGLYFSIIFLGCFLFVYFLVIDGKKGEGSGAREEDAQEDARAVEVQHSRSHHHAQVAGRAARRSHAQDYPGVFFRPRYSPLHSEK